MKSKKIKNNNNAVNEIIGTILMVTITIILAAVIFQMIKTEEGPNEKTQVDLVADMNLKTSLEGGGGIVNIMHKGGDRLDDDKTAIYIDIDNEKTELKISDGNGWEGKKSWDIGEKWSKYFSEITKDTKVKVMVIDSENNEILMRAQLQAGLSFPDYNPPIISISWCEPSMVPEDGSVPFKICATIIDSENNIPPSGTVTVNLLPISGSEAEQMSDFDDDDVFETKALQISNGTSIGTYTFEITAKDSYGNIAKGNVDLEVGSLDIILPTVEFTQPSVNAFVDSMPEIIGSFGDNIGGSGIDEGSISLKIDNMDLLINPTRGDKWCECTITSSSINCIFLKPLENGIHTATLSLRDKAGNQATTSLTFVTGGYLESYSLGGAQNFIILDQSGRQTTDFLEGDIVRVRISSEIVENADSKNRITIYDSKGNSTVIDQPFTLISNTAPYLFYDYCYGTSFDAPSVAGYYNIKIEITDSNGNKFSAQANLTIRTTSQEQKGKSIDPYYIKTYSDSNYNHESSTFYSNNNSIYVKIVAHQKGEVNNTNSDNIYIDDYILSHQIQNKPGDGAISNVQRSNIEMGIINYSFSINLSKNQFGWLQSTNCYTLSIQGLKNDANDLIFKGAVQIQITSPGKSDLEVNDNDVTLSNDNPTIGDNVYISIIVHNVGILDAFNVVVGVWLDNEQVGEDILPIIFAYGGDEEISIQWNVINHELATLMVVIDPYFSIGEYDETNNMVNKEVNIRYPILLVDDDDGDGETWNVHLEDYWTNVLNSSGFFYDLYTVPHGENGPGFDFMKDYDVVIWFSGRDNYGVGASLTSIDQSNLAMFMEDGGNFWMISQSLLYVLCNFDNDAPLTNPFAHEYLKVDDRSEDEGTRNPLPGVSGDPITDGLSIETSSEIFSGEDYCDDIILEPDGDGIFYGPGVHYCGIRHDSGIFKVVFFAFEFTFIVNESDRVELTEKTLDWIGVPAIANDVGITSLVCPENIQINKKVEINANIKNFGKNDQYNFNVQCSIIAQNGSEVYNNSKKLSLDSKSEKQLDWTWTPDTEGIYIVNVYTKLYGDEDNTNDESSTEIDILVFYDDMENGMNGWASDGTMLTTMFSDDFEAGNLNNWLIDNYNDGGVVTCSNTEAHQGTYCVKFFGDGSEPNNMYIERTFDLAGKTDVFLTWYWHDEDLEDVDYGYVSVCDGFSKSIEIVDSSPKMGMDSSIVIDSYNNPHISYLDDGNNILKYAKWTGSSWSIETVDDSNLVGRHTSIALDSNDYPHISYYDEANRHLKYARWDGSSWSKETVDDSKEVGRYTSLALDSNDYPHISYYDQDNENLKYAKWDGSSWSNETVDNSERVGWFTSIALDSNDYPHISYYDEHNKNLKYAKWNGISWSKETVDYIDFVGKYTSIALDSNDYPHISYYNESNKDLKYAKWTGSKWSIESVDYIDNVGQYTSIVLDNNDYPHISYYNESNKDLKYAKWNGNGWNIETMDTLSKVGMYTSIALDRSYNPYISYYDEENQELKCIMWDYLWDNNVITVWDGTDEDHITSPMNYEARGDPNLIQLDDYYNMIDGFIIRFGSRAGQEEHYDCLLIDDIKLSTLNTGNLWHQVDTRAHTSNTSFWCGEDSTGKYQGYLNNTLITPEINLTSGSSATLQFWHYSDFQGQSSNIDGGIVEITTNNGSTWTQITPINGYDDVLVEDGVNPIGGKEAFCYDSDWIEEEFDLTTYIGNCVKIRFHFGSNPTLNDEGWYIDDVRINRW